MKKQISLFTLAAASIAMSALQVSAQTKINMNDVNPPEGVGGTATPVLPSGMANPETITISGNIPEFIQFTGVDNVIELGNIGGPTLKGRAVSVRGRRGNDPAGGTSDIFKNTDTPDGQGDAAVEFRANTYVRITLSGSDIRNFGPDGIDGSTDDVKLQTHYRVAVKGKVIEYNKPGAPSPAPVFNAPGTASTGQNPLVATGVGAIRSYASYTGEATTDVENTGNRFFDYMPGAPVGTGGPGVNNDPNASSGIRVMAEIERDGLNDYRGAYSSNLNLTYYKY